MQTNMKRRLFLKASLATGAVGLAAGAGLLTPRTVLAEWNSAAFGAENVADALKAGLGSDALTDSAEIKLDIPKNPENGAVVPVAATTTLTGVESIDGNKHETQAFPEGLSCNRRCWIGSRRRTADTTDRAC